MKWSTQGVTILEKYYPTHNKEELLAIFNKDEHARSWRSVFKKANKLGFKKVTYKEAVNRILLEKYSTSPFLNLLQEVQRYIPGIKPDALVMRANRLGLNRRGYNAKARQKQIRVVSPSGELAWFLGVLAGDGYVTPIVNKANTYKVLMIGISEPFVNRFARIGEELFGIAPSLRQYNKYKLKGKWRKYYECVFFSKAMVEFFGDWKENVWSKTLTEKFSWTFNDKRFVASFLSGFFDADGSIRYDQRSYTKRISFAVQNKRSQRTIAGMIEVLGVRSKIYPKGIQIDGKKNVKKLAFKLMSSIPQKHNLIQLMRSSL